MSNFRKSYYSKIGFHGVEIKKTIETLLEGDLVDVEILARCCLEFELPETSRLEVWKYLLGVYPPIKEAAPTVQEQLHQQYQDLLQSSLLLRSELRPPESLQVAPNEEDSEARLCMFWDKIPSVPKELFSRAMAAMYSLNESCYAALEEDQLVALQSVAELWMRFCPQDRETSFWMFSAFVQASRRTTSEVLFEPHLSVLFFLFDSNSLPRCNKTMIRCTGISNHSGLKNTGTSFGKEFGTE
eukprot:m.164726 g.164726  ORF g.164726 m.164726 type:complete len:242 (-) comp24954_c0_seq5:47-772(-)